MCGLAGYIGSSKKPKISYGLATALFENLEIRGMDAAGIWGTEQGNGSIIYHKEPVNSSRFIKNEIWDNVKKLKPDLLLLHARYTSSGVGHARHNKNNHPFVSTDKTVAMVHNGIIQEACCLKEKYEIKSDTDSEILLRMFEHNMDQDKVNLKVDSDHIKRVMSGIKGIWSLITEGSMAVAFGERINKYERSLTLFHNEQRPLWLIDLRESLGQVFFFSEPEIWYRAISSHSCLRSEFGDSSQLVEMPIHQVWYLKVDKDNPHVVNDNFFKFEVEINPTTKKWKAGEKITILENKADVSVITNLDKNDNVIKKTCETEDCSDGMPLAHSLKSYKGYQKTRNEYDELKNYISVDNSEDWWGLEHDEVCLRISDLIANIGVILTNARNERSLSPSQYQETINCLEQTKIDLEGTLRIFESY